VGWLRTALRLAGSKRLYLVSSCSSPDRRGTVLLNARAAHLPGEQVPRQNQVLVIGKRRTGFGIVTKLASRVDVVHMKIGSTSAVVAAPPIALEYLAPQFPIRSWAEFEPRLLGARSIHVVFRICSRNSSFCARGRNSMSRLSENRGALGLHLSKFCPRSDLSPVLVNTQLLFR
jgi:hypothetical protein